MSQPIAYTSQPPRRSNGLGIAGFIVSLVGIFTAGVLCPIGLLLSFIALFRAPRGFAVAGFIIGLIGTAALAAVLFFFGFATFSCFSFGKPFMMTGQAMVQSQQKINTFEVNHGALPGDAEGNTLLSGERDGWGHPLRYEQTGPQSFEIRSAGPDGIFDNTDDMVQQQ